MTHVQKYIVVACSLLGFVAFCLWFYFEPGFEPAIGIIASVGGLVGSYWPQIRGRYSRKRLKGRVTFDYSNNNGRFVIGNNELLFETMWSKAGDDSIHVYNDPASIEAVALALGAIRISQITDATKYDRSNRTRTPQEGEIVVFKNKQGNYAAVHVIDVKDRTRADDRDELTFDYVINANGSADFS